MGFALFLWILIQLAMDDIFLNPIPFLIGSIFPDCDIKYSLIGKIFPLWIFLNHRGLTHSIIGLLTFSSPIMLYDWKICLLFAAGYFLHLIMDDCTPMGIKWFIGHKKSWKRNFQK